jgi:hypothetical protein
LIYSLSTDKKAKDWRSSIYGARVRRGIPVSDIDIPEATKNMYATQRAIIIRDNDTMIELAPLSRDTLGAALINGIRSPEESGRVKIARTLILHGTPEQYKLLSSLGPEWIESVHTAMTKYLEYRDGIFEFITAVFPDRDYIIRDRAEILTTVVYKLLTSRDGFKAVDDMFRYYSYDTLISEPDYKGLMVIFAIIGGYRENIEFALSKYNDWPAILKIGGSFEPVANYYREHVDI